MSFFSRMFGRKPAPVAPKPELTKVSHEPAPIMIQPSSDIRFKRHLFRALRLVAALEKAYKNCDAERAAALNKEFGERRAVCGRSGLELPDNEKDILAMIENRGWSK